MDRTERRLHTSDVLSPLPAGHLVSRPTLADAADIFAVVAAADIEVLGRPDATLDDLRDELTESGFDPATDGWLVRDAPPGGLGPGVAGRAPVPSSTSTCTSTRSAVPGWHRCCSPRWQFVADGASGDAVLATLAEHRGRGLGRRLLRAYFDDMRARGRTVVLVTVDSENETGALGLYESVGIAGGAGDRRVEPLDPC